MLLLSRTPRKSYSNFTFLLVPSPSFFFFFTCTSILSSFRRRRVRGLISISFYTRIRRPPREKSGSFESRGIEFYFFHVPFIRTRSSLRNVFARRTARLLLKATLLVSTMTITFGLAMREFLFNEKKKIGIRGRLGGDRGGGEEGKA